MNYFTSATWNADGGSWSDVQTLINNYGLHVLAIQEAGSIMYIFPPLISTYQSLTLCLAGTQINYENIGFQEYTWNIPSPHPNITSQRYV